MFRRSPKVFILLCVVFCQSIFRIGAYSDICDEPSPSIFCSCDTRPRETTVTCFIISDMDSDNPVWVSLAGIENVASLKLNSHLPVRLGYIPTESLKSMSDLHTLIIREGRLGELQSYAVSGIKNLRDLALEGNEITSMQKNAISNLPKLKRLTMSDNFLEEVLADSMTELLDLEQLFLDRNNISRIEACAFCELQNLKELELWGNQITDITEYTFRGLRYLKRLDLSRNRISILNDKVFHAMPKLSELDLQRNVITHIAPNALACLEKLQILKLNSNKLKMLPDEVFKLPKLRSVELTNNELETIQVEVLDFMPFSKDEHFSFLIKDNPFKCDCRLNWVKSYLSLSKSHQFTRELKELQCIPEGENGTLLLAHTLNLECKRPTTLGYDPSTSTSSSPTPEVKWVPLQISTRENSTKRMDEVADDTYFGDDEEEQSESGEMEVKEHSGCGSITPQLHVIIFVALCTVFLVRKRKGTQF